MRAFSIMRTLPLSCNPSDEERREPRTPTAARTVRRKPMSQRKTSTRLVTLLTVGGGLAAAAPALVTQTAATAAEWAPSNTHQVFRTRGDRGFILRRTTKNRGP